jgi:hypothetical protein
MTATRTSCTSFEGTRRIATGDLAHVALRTKKILDRGESAPVLIFDDATGELIEIDFRGSPADVLRRIEAQVRPAAAAPSAAPSDSAAASDTTATNTPTAPAPPPPPRGRGRPKLGVVAREVTLLPRHWDWLGAQPGGASVALRKLVEDARRTSGPRDRVRGSQDAAYRFMSALAGNLPGFEEAARALFAANRERFAAETDAWPADVRDHARKMADAAFDAAAAVAASAG